ncbi:hypothetical protein ACU6VI_05010 [Sphaerotilus natans]|uniref:hypothetical protein n=1 Tax=Sphaerotilus natans TaxID=34103 RepID=UPI00406CDC92
MAIFLSLHPLLRRCGLAVVLLAGGCAPALDWRDVAVADGLVIQFPCRPERAERAVRLLERSVPARMSSCDAAGLGWSVTTFDVDDPGRVSETLRHLRGRLAANLQAEESQSRAVEAPGLTPQQEARRLLLSGRSADARPVEAEVLIAARGLQVLQVVAITRGEPVSRWRDRAQEFIGSLRPAS